LDEHFNRPLYRRYPALRPVLPHLALGALPTPVERLAGLEGALGVHGAELYIKRDDLSGNPYGGNKVRKLEFLLAHAVACGFGEVLTFGAAGSNHALATAIYAKSLGLGCISMLVPQPNSHGVRKNLLLSLHAGSEIHHAPGIVMTALATIRQLGARRMRTGRLPCMIPPGGSSPLGTVGFVNAALELRLQIEAGVLPEPDCIYAASGTMGTAVGLLLGLKAAALRTRVSAVRVTAAGFTSMQKAKRLFYATNKLLHETDPAFPLLSFPGSDFALNHDFYGNAYGLYTDKSVEAVRLFLETSGISLEGTYTGKAAAALIADARAGRLKNKRALFWNTHNSHDFGREIRGLDYHDLPKSFHRYFEEDVQPLDRRSGGVI
jgi:D-cysteine desulfhydrase